MTELKTSCPKCEGHIAYPAEIACQQITCPHCGETILLPGPPRKSSRSLLLAAAFVSLGCAFVLLVWRQSQRNGELAARNQAPTTASRIARVVHTNGLGAGHARSNYAKGLAYCTGRGAPQSYGDALKYFRLAADAGHAGAEDALGRLYLKGWGTDVDYQEAIRWFRKAAEQGFAEGQYDLGSMLISGFVAKNAPEAEKWLLSAAQHGYAPAQDKLAFDYKFGFNFAVDMGKTLKWYAAAAAQGNARAQMDRRICT